MPFLYTCGANNAVLLSIAIFRLNISVPLIAME